jgi:tetratricopeptide (TPR) repeat protein
MGACLFFMLAFWGSALGGGVDSPASLPDAALENQRGMKFYKHGFYELIPRGQKSEAMQEFAHAEKAFKKAIEIDNNYIHAHRNLARLYFAQENFHDAAAEYAQILRLEPDNLDNYALMALALTAMGNTDEAIEYLELVKTRTTDELIHQKVDQYIADIKAEE